MISIIMEFLCLFLRSHFEETSGGIAKCPLFYQATCLKMSENKPVIQEFLCCMTSKMSKNDGNDHEQPESVLLSCTCRHLGCLLFDRKFAKFWMAGKW